MPAHPLAAALVLLATVTAASGAEKSVRVARRAGPAPHIDGHLDEAVWLEAPVLSDFVQREPEEGAAPTERTEVQLLFDAEALYVGVRLRDREPDLVAAPLTRRDVDVEGDRITVELDPYHDHLSGYRFTVTAAGVKLDAALALDTWADPTWDGIWDGAAGRDAFGWTAEFRIPFRSLRFGTQPAWGLNLTRTIGRRGETDTWSIIPRHESGWVRHFGELVGLEGLDAPRHLALVPFTLGRFSLHPDGHEASASAGGEIRWSPARQWSLLATINPDFGQVEADPSLLNLSAFETQFPEQRPFFVEGAADFKTPFQLFFSRRIGAAPGLLKVPRGERELDRPPATSIYSATRLTGRSEGGLQLGVLEAVTAPEYAEVERKENGATVRARRLLEPLSNWLVARARQALGKRSGVGAMVTAVHRRGREPAWSGGLDWVLRPRHGLSFDGQIVGSRAGSGEDRRGGAGIKIGVRKLDGKRLLANLDLEALTPGLNLRDLGYLRRGDRLQVSAGVDLRSTTPGSGFRQWTLHLGGFRQWTWARLPLETGLDLSASAELPSRSWIGGGFEVRPRGFDDLAGRGGPTIAWPLRWDGWAYYTMPETTALAWAPDMSVAGDSAGSSAWSVGLGVTWRPSAGVALTLRPLFEHAHDAAQWVENVYLDGSSQPSRSLYAALDRRTLDIALRADLTLTPTLSIEFFAQPFMAVGHYGPGRALAADRSYDFAPEGLRSDPDFAYRVLKSNLVVRWEYRPGSVVYLAWSQERDASGGAASLRPGHDLGEILRAPGDHVLLVKISHWID